MAKIMPESLKRAFPINNPPSEKSVAVALNKTKTNDDFNRDRKEEGLLGEKKERVQPAEAIIKCQSCGREQKTTFRFSSPPEWHKCIWCGELQPMDGYHVTAYGLGLPRVLAPYEVKARARELEILHANETIV